MYVLDTNAVIYYLSNEGPVVELIARAQEEGAILYVPTIVRLELLSKPDLTPDEHVVVLNFLEACRYVHLDTSIADIAADIRRLYKLKTPDSIIAASALYTGATLVTRNSNDFKQVKHLHVRKI